MVEMPEVLGGPARCAMRTGLQLYVVVVCILCPLSTLFQRHLVVREKERDLIGRAEEDAHKLQKGAGDREL